MRASRNRRQREVTRSRQPGTWMDLELKPWGTYAVREPFFKGRYLIGPVIITRTQQIVPKWEPVETLTNGHIRCELVSIEIL